METRDEYKFLNLKYLKENNISSELSMVIKQMSLMRVRRDADFHLVLVS